MKKIILLFLLLQNILFGCAACQLMTPTSEIHLELKTEKETLKSIHVEWVFTDTFIQTLLVQYDENDNNELDPNELQEVKSALLDYLLADKIGMATQLKFAQNPEQDATLLQPNFSNFTISMEGDNIIFSYDIEQTIALHNNALLSLVFKDPNNFFAFIITDLKIDSKEFSYEENLYLFTASIVFKSDAPLEQVAPEIKKAAEPKPAVSQQENLLKESIQKVQELFKSIKDETNPLTYISLLIFAYIYGLIHALGPGHGKTLVASYFLTNDRSYSKALFVSLAIGVVHTFSAFILTLIIYFGVNTFLSQFMQDSVNLTTKISALIIIGIALYLIVKKYRAYNEIKKREKSPVANMSFSTTPHPSTCGCGTCKVEENSTDTALIISAGIIPCPGTTTIFIFALSLGLYFAGFLSALVMSLGMSTIIYVSALLSVTIRKKTATQNTQLKKYLEYGSLVIILILGFLLLLT